MTQDGPARVIWAGSRTLGPAELRSDPGQLPIQIDPGAIANTHRLRLSPQHAVQIFGLDGVPVLVRAKNLAEARVKGVRVAHGVQSVTYHHLLLDRHAVLSAAGTLVERMYPGRVALAAFSPAARLSIAAAIHSVCKTTDARIVDLLDLSQLYGPRYFPLLARRDALRACRMIGDLTPLAQKVHRAPPPSTGRMQRLAGQPRGDRMARTAIRRP